MSIPNEPTPQPDPASDTVQPSPLHAAADAAASSIESSPSILRRALEDARRELLDLSARNRLLNTARKRTRSSSVEILDEKSQQVFEMLVRDGKAMSFLPRPEKEASTAIIEYEEPKPLGGYVPEDAPVDEPEVVFDIDLSQPDEDQTADETDDDDKPATRHRDKRLQTGMTSKLLQKRLLRQYYDARTFQEEQGVNILYLALGFLKWKEIDSKKKERHAPLILVPVELQRQSAGSRFRISYTGDDIATNLSLQVKLKTEFNIELPEIIEQDDFDPATYFDAVEKCIDGQDGWEVQRDDIVLWFFSFAKLLMYRDLDPANWPSDNPLEDNNLVKSLLLNGFEPQPPLCDADDNIDFLIDPADMVHVMNADSSQSLAIEEARHGRNLVIQGPPGTGKSQTIANIIAASVKNGKKVLFVAEKVAALDVVKRRLTNVGLGDMCLALHSHNAKKRLVLDELGRTLDLEKPIVHDVQGTSNDLKEARDRLNTHAVMMHTKIAPSEHTPFQVIGELVNLQAIGVPAVDFDLPQPEAWSPDTLDSHRKLIRECALYVDEIGIPSEHPWRGVMRQSILPTDVQRLNHDIPPIKAKVDAAEAATVELTRALFAEIDPTKKLHTFGHARAHVTLAAMVTDPPPMDAAAYADPVWDSKRSDITELVQIGVALRDATRSLDGVVNDSAWTTDLATTRRDLEEWGRSLFRMLNGSYRRARRTLKSILHNKPPKRLEERLNIIDTIARIKESRAQLEQSDALGRAAFGNQWNGEATDWSTIATLETWDRTHQPKAPDPVVFRAIVVHLEDRKAVKQLSIALDHCLDEAQSASQTIFEMVQFRMVDAFGNEDDIATSQEEPSGTFSFDDIAIDELQDRFTMWQANPEEISKWIAFHTRYEQLIDCKLDELAARLYDGRISARNLLDRFHMAYYESLLRDFVEQRPMLGQFDGLSHERILERFQQLDVQRIQLACEEVAAAHYEMIPKGGSSIGELGLIRHELSKKRRHLPIRQLLKRAGTAITRIKPVFMMSPLSIAQYVEPGALDFDILLIDEASQVRPIDALGAIARAEQIIVVGDDKQLPPTRFFNTVLTEDDMPEEDLVDQLRAGDVESILGLCASRSMPDRMLRWHYRSKHQSLIAVSNEEFYENKLYIIPSPGKAGGSLGLRFHHVEDGTFDRGKSATNKREASVVAQAVMQHAREHPNQTLGIGAFSVSQRDAIVDELEVLRRKNPDLEPFFATSTEEPFFVKNLENIQGDERDVIYISVGYAPDDEGKFTMNFGPLSNDGGERRLNVLITRAKMRCEVFSSITGDMIDLSRATGKGPAAFRTFLEYAQHGTIGGKTTETNDVASVFQQSLIETLEERGFDVDPQIGVGGTYVDLAVKNPEDASEYLLGIECDGPSYAGARSARDRDRTWSAVLKSRGWLLHRIWAIDWFNRPEEQLAKLLNAIDHAKVGIDDKVADAHATKPRLPGIQRAEGTAKSALDDVTISVPYKEAKFRVPRAQEVHEVGDGKLARVITRIVEVEGPVHRDEVTTRVRTLWNMSRAGSRMQRAVDSAMTEAWRTGMIAEHDNFLTLPAQDEISVRDRSDVESSGLRSNDMLPPTEIRECLRLLVETHLGVTRDEVIVATARSLGFKSTSPQLREVIDRQIDAAIAECILGEEGEKLSVVAGANESE